jgi:hypothetical protein
VIERCEEETESVEPCKPEDPPSCPRGRRRLGIRMETTIETMTAENSTQPPRARTPNDHWRLGASQFRRIDPPATGPEIGPARWCLLYRALPEPLRGPVACQRPGIDSHPRQPSGDNPHSLPDRTPRNPHPPRTRSPLKTTARSGTSWAFPWAWTYSQVCRGPEARRRSGKPRPAPVSRPGSWLKSSESDPLTEAVKAGWPVERDKTLSRFCPVQKSKNFVSRGQEHSAALRVPFRLGGKS